MWAVHDLQPEEGPKSWTHQPSEKRLRQGPATRAGSLIDKLHIHTWCLALAQCQIFSCGFVCGRKSSSGFSSRRLCPRVQLRLFPAWARLRAWSDITRSDRYHTCHHTCHGTASRVCTDFLLTWIRGLRLSQTRCRPSQSTHMICNLHVTWLQSVNIIISSIEYNPQCLQDSFFLLYY